MTTEQLVERLQGCPQLEGIPREQLTWMALHGRWRRFEEGAVLVSKGVPVVEVHFMLQGHFVFYVQRGGLRSKVIEWHKGKFFGQAPYSRLVVSPGDGVFGEASEIVSIHREHFPKMIRDCYDLTEIMVHGMIDRARQFNAAALHDEKMVSLGKLAAGLAHELNNPASAIARSAHNLGDILVEADEAARVVGAAGLTEVQVATATAVRDSCLIAQVASIRSPLEQVEREDEIGDWLEDHGVDATLAESLAESPITLDGLEQLAAALEGEGLEMAIRWVSQSCLTRSLGAGDR